MAERLLGSLAKGTYRATVEPAKQAVEQAIDPKIMRSVFSAGLIGPLIRSIVSEYDKKDEGGQKDKPQVISSDLSRGLEAMSSQLSTLASIMDDIRELTKSQLLTDKDQFNKTLRQTQKADLQAIEDKLEGKKPSVSSLVDPTKKDDKNRLGIVSSLFDFVKNNPILSALLGAGLLASSKTIQKFFEGLSESALPGMVSEGFQSFKDNLSVGVGSILENLGLSVGTEVSKIITSGLISGLVSKLILRRFGLGFLVGAGIEGVNQIKGSENQEGSQNKSEASPFGDISSALGIVLAASMAGSAIKGGKKIFDIGKGIFGSKAPAIAGAGAAAAAGAAIGPSMAGTAPSPGGIQVPGYSRGREEIGREEKSLKRVEEKRGFKGLVNRVRRLNATYKGKKNVALIVSKIIAARVGVALASTIFTGPIGLVLAVLSAGLTLYQFSDILDEMEETETGGADASGDQDDATSMQGTPSGQAQASVRPPVSSTGNSMDDYTRKVIAAESGGQNIKNPLSSASGVYQIMDKTFEGLKKNNPSTLGKYTKEQFDNDVNIQKEFFEALTKENAEKLTKAGFEANEKNMYLTHRFGITDALSILRKSKEPGGMQSNLKDVIPSGRFAMIVKQNPDIKEGTTIAGAMLGAYSKMDKNIQMSAPASTTNNMTPEKNPLMNVGIIGELSRFYEMATGQPLVINNNQSSSVMSGGGGGDNRPTAQPVHAPNSGEQDRLRDMYGFPAGFFY